MSQHITQYPDVSDDLSKVTFEQRSRGAAPYGKGRIHIFTKSDKFHVPAYVKEIRVYVQGPGGGSGKDETYTYGKNNLIGITGAGGGGGFVCGVKKVIPGSVYDVVVGVCDVANRTTTDSAFGNMIATGGEWGATATTKNESDKFVYKGGAGGVGSGGDYHRAGGKGGDTLASPARAGGGGSAGFGGGFPGGQHDFDAYGMESEANGPRGCGGAGVGGDGGPGGGGGGGGGRATGQIGGPSILGVISSDTTFLSQQKAHEAIFGDAELLYYNFDTIGMPLICYGYGGNGGSFSNGGPASAREDAEHGDNGWFGGGGGGGGNFKHPNEPIGYGYKAGNGGNGGFGGGGGGGGAGDYSDANEYYTNVMTPGDGGNGGLGGGGGAAGGIIDRDRESSEQYGGLGGDGFVIIEW